MRLFRQTFRDGDGEVREVSKWYFEFRFDGRIRRVPLFADRSASMDASRQIRRLIDCRGSGEPPSAALVQWLERMPPKLRDRLIAMQLVDSRRVAACRTLVQHVEDFGEALKAKGTSERQVELACARVKRVAEGCKFVYWSEISAGKVQAFIAGLRKDTKAKRGISAQTANYYLGALKQFCRWAVRDGRASESPVGYLDGWNARTDRRHDRRALSTDEVMRLLRAAEKGPEVLGMTGPERGMLYRLALETGLRAGELRSLTRGSFKLDGSTPTVTVEAGYSKHRREDVQPIRPALAADLKNFLGTKVPGARAFAVPRREQVAQLIQADLKAARSTWLDEAANDADRANREATDFLVYKDAAGRYADFHALRHSFITNLVRGGVHPKTAQVLARHCTITLTMDRYAHSFRGVETAALAVLPDLSGEPQQLQATGTA